MVRAYHTPMITEITAPVLLRQQLPGLAEAYRLNATPYQLFGFLASTTSRMARSGDLLWIRRCFNLVNVMLINGNETVKACISNVYLYGLSPLLDRTHPLANELKQLMPFKLRSAYQSQLKSIAL